MASCVTSVQNRAKLLKARTLLAEQDPFLGYLALSLPIQVVPGDEQLTAAVRASGQCFFGETFLDQLSVPEVVTVILHETLHLALDCFQRRGVRHAILWNLAHDLAVNALIGESEGADKHWAWPAAFPPLLEEPLQAMAAESIYDLLWYTLQQELIETGIPGLMVDRSASGQPRDLQDLWTPEQREAARRVLRSQGTWVVDLDADAWESLDTEARDRLRLRWQEALLGAAEQALGSRGIGDLPPWAQRLLGPLMMPVIPWHSVLARKIHGHLIGSRRSFSRPGRRSQAAGAVLPGRLRHRGVVGVFVDVSGSISPQELNHFLTELKGILEQTEHSARLILWDTEVTLDLLVEDAANLQVSLLGDWEQVLGGGGTDPACVIRHLESDDQEAHPTFAVLLTDGYVPWPLASDWPMDLLVVTTGPHPEPELEYDSLTLEIPA